MLVEAGVPEPRNEEESILAYRIGQLERSVNDLKVILQEANLAVLTYKVSELERWRTKILTAVGALTLLFAGKVLNDLFGIQIGDKT